VNVCKYVIENVWLWIHVIDNCLRRMEEKRKRKMRKRGMEGDGGEQEVDGRLLALG
jgi:hypothetical protein